MGFDRHKHVLLHISGVICQHRYTAARMARHDAVAAAGVDCDFFVRCASNSGEACDAVTAHQPADTETERCVGTLPASWAAMTALSDLALTESNISG